MANAPQPNGPSQQNGASSTSRGVLRVADYELKEVIGDRGTGTVYCARHIPSDKQVAIKILHSRRQDVVDGLVRGATAISRVHHANLVDITDVGATRDGTVFLAMELLIGESLHDRLQRVGPLPLFDAVNIVRQVAHGLGAAHAADVIHGGLEPAKIFLCRRDGRRRVVRRSNATDMKLVVEPEGKFDLVKILDLGLKRFLDLASYQSDVRETARYWSPEQAQRRPVDLRSDIYSLGAVFYEMITGTVPFDGASLAEVLRQHVSGMVTAPSQRTPSIAIDALVDTVILRCLQKTPSLRFANTNELCDALDACVTDCAFLRDAHHLPGIETSGIELPEARTKPGQKPEGQKAPQAQAPTPQAAKPETSAAKPAPSPTPPKPRATQSVRIAVEKPRARTTPPLPQPVPPVSARVAPPPTPITAARKTLPGVTPTPPVPVTHVAPPPLAKTVSPPELITVEQSELVEIPTPPPVSLSSDLLTEIADAPAPAEAVAAPTSPARAEVSNETLGHVEKEVATSEVGKLAEPAATTSRTEVPPTTPDAAQPAESVPSPIDALLEPESAQPVEPAPPPAANAHQPESPVVDGVEKAARAEAAAPASAVPPISQPFDHGDRVDGEDDEEDDLLAATWETWRRPKVMAIAAVALLGGIGVAVWASRSKSASPGKPTIVATTSEAKQAIAKPATPPPAPPPAQAPSQEPTPTQAGAPPSQALAPSAATPVPEATPSHAVATETPPPPQVPAPTAPAAVVLEAKLSDKPAAPAAARTATPPSAEATRPSEAAPTRSPTGVAGEPKPVSPKSRPAPTAAREPEPTGRDVPTTTEASAAPKRTPTAPANLPPRLAAAWPTAARTAPAPAATVPAPNPATKSPEQPKATGGKAVPQTAPASADQLVRDAQRAWMAGQHAFALSRAQAALAASPKPAQAVQAYEIIATCSCTLHKRDQALEAASHLDMSRREAVKTVCAKNGVPFQ